MEVRVKYCQSARPEHFLYICHVRDKSIDDAILQDDRPIITVEDHGLSCGFGSALMEQAALSNLPGRVIIPIGSPREFIRHNKRSEQLKQAGINADKIVAAAVDIINLDRLKRATNRIRHKAEI